jgi:AcrR family transcriptional regulator
MNKNDKRYIKTEKIIIETFIKLKAKAKRVKVTELCEEAMINKSTFYTHYETVQILQEQIQRKVIEEIFKKCVEQYDIFKETDKFIYESIKVELKNRELLNHIFDNGANKLNVTVDVLTSLYGSKCKKEEDKMMLAFVFGGVAQIFQQNMSDKSIHMAINYAKSIVDR